MNKVLATIIGVLIVGGVGWFVISNRTTPGESENQAQSERAPDFALQDYDGKTVRLADFAGKPLVLNAWAAWCPFCVKELPDFAEAQEEFGDTVVIIAIDRAEPLAVAKEFSDKVGVTGRLLLLLDPSDSFYRSIGGFSMPETIFVNAAGEIVIHKRGPMDLDEIREKIQQLILTSEERVEM